MDKKINLVTAGQIRNDIPEFHIGDTIAISVNVIEGDKERIQIFKGIVMGIKGGGISKTFRVRKISNGVGVERIFPINSPRIAKLEVIKQGSVRRAKLYYLRGLTGKAATKIKEKKKPGKVLATAGSDKETVSTNGTAKVEAVKEEAVS